jgi:hypothetical protein
MTQIAARIAQHLPAVLFRRANARRRVTGAAAAAAPAASLHYGSLRGGEARVWHHDVEPGQEVEVHVGASRPTLITLSTECGHVLGRATGEMEVRLSARAEGSHQVHVRVENPGPGVASLALQIA